MLPHIRNHWIFFSGSHGRRITVEMSSGGLGRPWMGKVTGSLKDTFTPQRMPHIYIWGQKGPLIQGNIVVTLCGPETSALLYLELNSRNQTNATLAIWCNYLTFGSGRLPQSMWSVQCCCPSKELSLCSHPQLQCRVNRPALQVMMPRDHLQSWAWGQCWSLPESGIR